MHGSAQVFELNPHEIQSVGYHNPGLLGMDRWGDLFRFVKAGASNISAGKLQLAPAPKANHHNVAWASGGALNTNKVTVTLGATAAVANEYVGGTLVVNDATGEGVTYRIVGHPAADSGATLEITIEGVFRESLASGSELTLVHNAWNGVVEAAVEERQPAGIPLVDITAAHFGWVKTYGQVAALAGAAIDLGADVTSHASTAGAVAAMSDTAATSLDQIKVGVATVAGVDTEYRPILVQIY